MSLSRDLDGRRRLDRDLRQREWQRESWPQSGGGRSHASQPVQRESSGSAGGDVSVSVTQTVLHHVTFSWSSQTYAATGVVCDVEQTAGLGFRRGFRTASGDLDTDSTITDVYLDIGGVLQVSINAHWPSASTSTARVVRTRSGVERSETVADMPFDVGLFAGSTVLGMEVAAGDTVRLEFPGMAGETLAAGEWTLSVLKLPKQPDPAAGVWVGEDSPATLRLLDTQSGAVERTLDVSATFPSGIVGPAVADDGNLWVVDVSDGDLVELDQTDGSVLSSVASGAARTAGRICWHDGSIWQEDPDTDRTVHEVDPADGSVLSSFSAPALGANDGITSDGADLWLAVGSVQVTVHRVNTSGTLQEAVEFGTSGALDPSEFNFAALGWVDGQLWAADVVAVAGTDIVVLDTGDASLVRTVADPSASGAVCGIEAAR